MSSLQLFIYFCTNFQGRTTCTWCRSRNSNIFLLFWQLNICLIASKVARIDTKISFYSHIRGFNRTDQGILDVPFSLASFKRTLVETLQLTNNCNHGLHISLSSTFPFRFWSFGIFQEVLVEYILRLLHKDHLYYSFWSLLFSVSNSNIFQQQKHLYLSN